VKKFKVITTTQQIYFIFADNLEQAWEKWFESYGRCIVAQAMIEQK